MRKIAYPTDLTDAQWHRLQNRLPARPQRGRPATAYRTVVNATLYLLRAGCAWRMLPADFGRWRTIYGWFTRWSADGTWERLHDRLRNTLRRALGKTPQPTAAILDSQSAKTGGQGGPAGHDAGKKILGRKRHVLVDTLGLLLARTVGPAKVQDRDGARTLLARTVGWFGRLAKIWADGGYAGQLVPYVKGLRPHGQLHLDIVRRRDTAKGFTVQPKRWIVERTFGWLIRQRRLVRDYERKPAHSETFLFIAMSSLMLKRLAPVDAK